jgi:ribosomal protein S18 acetylase RimI-like enzyme
VTLPFRIELLDTQHDRVSFDCGTPALDKYFREQVTQDVRRRVTACYVLVQSASGSVCGFYTIAAASLAITGLPPALAKQLPRYPALPVAKVGRLAISLQFQGQRLGGALMADAAHRAIRSEIGIFALVVDAKTNAASSFYERLGFVPLDGPGRQLVQPLKNLAKLL